MSICHTLRRHRPLGAFALLIAALVIAATCVSASAQTWSFTDASAAANVRYQHGYLQTTQSMRRAIAAGVAAGDYDKDGWIDLFMVRGDAFPHVLLRNKGDGTFEDVAGAAGISVAGAAACGPLFADLNGDGWLDLFLGGIEGTQPVLFLNNGDGTFEDVTPTCGIDTSEETFSACAGDYDRDGDLDLVISHWWGDFAACSRLWQNQGDATFVCVDYEAGTAQPRGTLAKFGFTPNFADINSDGWPDLLIASDFGTSQVYMNNGGGTFTDVTDSIITDQNGMGAAVGDYDNDGDLDWFVSSIWDLDGAPGGNGPLTGNRMYQNNGDGTFVDATDATGVRIGWWGWGSSFGDFNNDGHLDLYHVNGFPFDDPEFVRDPAVLFISNGDGTFTERADSIGAKHLGQGRGVVCFDYDRDGDLDIFVVSANGLSILYRNNGGNNLNYLAVKLRGNQLNSEAIGARVYATTGNVTQMRELRAGSNFVSQDPAEAHFGLGNDTSVDVLRIVWPDGEMSELSNVPANQVLTVSYPTAPPSIPPVIRPKIFEIGPNPSANQFTIRFQIPSGASGLLAIYDVAGRLVSQSESFTSTGDPRTIVWMGTTTQGNLVATGVYFLRIESTRGTSDSKRIVIVR